MDQTVTAPISSMELKPNSIEYLNEIRKWTMFFAILGFIVILLMIVGGMAAGTFMSMAGVPYSGSLGVGFAIIYLIAGLLMFFPMLYLFRFSNKTKKAINEKDSVTMEEGFLNLKRYFRYTGIVAIVFISFYLIFFIAIIIGGFAGTFMHKGF